MKRSARYAIRFGYGYSVMLGVIRFAYDFRNGRIYSKWQLSCYSLLVNIVMVSAIPLQFLVRVESFTKYEILDLYKILYFMGSLVRTTVVLLTLVLNWLGSGETISIIKEFQRLHRSYFKRLIVGKVEQQRFDNSIVRKFLWLVAADVTNWLLTLESLSTLLNWQMLLCILAYAMLMSVLITTLNLYYFAVRSLSLHFELLNTELARIISLAALKRKSPTLADDMDELALGYMQLHKLAKRVNSRFEVQGICLALNFYLNNIVSLYLFACFLLDYPDVLHITGWVGSALVYLSGITYYGSFLELLAAPLGMLDKFAACKALLRQLLQLESKDVRLEKSLEKFCFQISNDPLEITLLGLCRLDRAMTFTNVASTISRTIFIIQYDYAKRYTNL